MGEKIVNIRIRFPEEVRDRVKGYADRDRRSLNSEVLALLEEAMNAREQGKSPPAFSYDTPREHATGRLLRAAEPRPSGPAAR